MPTTQDALELLLEQLAPDDVLMPVAKGSKHPMYPHKGGRWTRGKFREFVESAARSATAYDVCVLLRGLCVIDVDTHELCVQLELRFPLLKVVASETTKRGKHYWFRRSALADQEGFFDGAAQIEAHVDFKTLTSSGTAGVVVVAPSSGGRAWCVELSRETLMEIPEELLRTVAIGQGPLRTLSFFDNASSLTLPSFTLVRMGYFEPFMDADEPLTGTIPVPCDRADFEELVAALDSGMTLTSRVDAVVELADKLGLVDVERFAERIIARAAYDADADPDMAAAMVTTTTTTPIPEDGILFDRDPTVPLGCFLFGPEPRFEPGQVVVEPPSGFESRVHPTVLSLMKKHPLALAGGAALAALAPSMKAGADYDLFLYGVDESGADAVLQSVHEELRKEDAWQWIRTSRACTFVLSSDDDTTVVIQVILRIYDAPERVPASFDLAPCKVCAWYSSEQTLHIEASPEFFVALRQCAFPVDVRMWNRASVARVIKYCAKGMDVYLPGLRRSRVKARSAGESFLGVVGLLEAEKTLGREHRPELAGIAAALHKNALKSGYDEDALKLTNRLCWVVKNLIRRGVQFLFPSRSSINKTPDIVLWHRANMTVHCPAALEGVHDDAYAYVTGFKGLSRGRRTTSRHDALVADGTFERGNEYDADLVAEALRAPRSQEDADDAGAASRTLGELRLSTRRLKVVASKLLTVQQTKWIAKEVGSDRSLQNGLLVLEAADLETLGKLLIKHSRDQPRVKVKPMARHRAAAVAAALCLSGPGGEHRQKKEEAALRTYVSSGGDAKACIAVLSAP